MMEPRLRRHEYGFLELVDRPSEDELAQYYAQTYFQTERANYRSSYPPEELEVIRLRIALRAARARALRGDDRPGSLLDVGCGEGFVLAHFHAEGWDVAGIDFSRAGVEAMNPEMSAYVEQADVFHALDRLISGSDRYDLVWLGNVLEHVLDPVGLLMVLRNLVAPGGLLVATVPNDGSRYQENLLETGDIPERFWIAAPDHMSYFTADALRTTADNTGWECLDIQADFPIDLFLAHEGSNYVRDRAKGPAAHRARLRVEGIIGEAGLEAASAFYSALAGVGLGRNLTAYLRPTLQTAEPA